MHYYIYILVASESSYAANDESLIGETCNRCDQLNQQLEAVTNQARGTSSEQSLDPFTNAPADRYMDDVSSYICTQRMSYVHPRGM
jgi:hypothetical protein